MTISGLILTVLIGPAAASGVLDAVPPTAEPLETKPTAKK